MKAIQLDNRNRILALTGSKEINRKLESILFQKAENFELEYSNDSSEATSLLAHFNYRVILCEVENWVKSNNNLCNFFQQNYRQQSAHWIFLAKSQNKHHIIDCLVKGKSDYVLYPCDDAFLAAKINNALQLQEFHNKQPGQSHLYKLPQKKGDSSARQAQSRKTSGMSELKNKRSMRFSVNGIEYVLKADAAHKDATFRTPSMKTLFEPFKKIITDMDLVDRNRKVSTHMFVKKKGEYHKLRYKDICWIKSDSDYLKIKTEDEKFFILSTMNKMLEELPDEQFIRIHRSFIVPVGKIDIMNQRDRYVIIEGDNIPVSKTYLPILQDRLNIY